MEKKFWFERWKKNEIGFHESEVTPLLARHYGALSLDKGNCVFVPLCGKSLDMGWLVSKGYRVVGVELCKEAVIQLFLMLEVTPEIKSVNGMSCYSAENIDVYVGDIFQLTQEMIGSVNAVFDRGSLVALPDETRVQYSRHITDITVGAPQLLISYDYDQGLRAGPPFSVDEDEINLHYGDVYDACCLASHRVESKFGVSGEIREMVWLLKTRKSG